MTSPEPLVLLHGLGMSPRVWDGTRPHLDPHHRVVAMPLLGHRGGDAPDRHPVTVSAVVDHAAQALDDLGLERAHLAGNSLGGWVAIELARRGRALTVCALSPAGTWTAGTVDQTSGVRKIRRAARMARLGRPVPSLMRFAALRRLAFRDVAVHGDRLSPAEAVETTNDVLACTVLDDILGTREELAPLDPLPCPITLAWASDDRILPLDRNGAVAQRRLPAAPVVVVRGAGHVPMIDDPAQVAGGILDATRRHQPTPAPR
jgi:pimeloyl-ACP methyl ester carboxylesterase